VDLDSDGFGDILSGCYSRREEEMAGLFYVLRGLPGGKFRAAEVLLGNDGQPLIIQPEREQNSEREQRDPALERICTRPFAIDWDGDGFLDLVVGNFAGTFYWFKGLGKGKFKPQAEQLRTEGKPLRIAGYHSDPFVIDWDGDGDLDILSGTSQGGVQWAENVAGPRKLPELGPFRWLIRAEQMASDDYLRGESDVQAPGLDTRVWAADVNGDGKLDLLIGDRVILNYPVEGLTVEQFRAKREAWQKAFTELMERTRPPESDQEAQAERRKKLRELFEERNQFIKEEATGFVWVYLRK
jgi:hypothetical protein